MKVLLNDWLTIKISLSKIDSQQLANELKNSVS